jgi:F-type H+-transporting ATPase subunit epsilon
MEVLYGHAPLMAELGAGDVIVHGGGEAGAEPESALRWNVSWGFAEVLGDRVTILASDALKPEEISVPRAELQLERGQKEWNEAGDSADAYTEALRVIHEAEAKIASATEKS